MSKALYVVKRLNEMRDTGHEPAVLAEMVRKIGERAVEIKGGASLSPEQSAAVTEHAFREIIGEVAPGGGASSKSATYKNIQEFYTDTRREMASWPTQKVVSEVERAKKAVVQSRDAIDNDMVERMNMRPNGALEAAYFERVERAASLARVIESGSPDHAKILRDSYAPKSRSDALAERAQQRVADFEESAVMEKGNKRGMAPKPRM